MVSKFIDVHAHLDMCKDFKEVIKKAKEKDILILAAGVDHKSNATLVNLVKDFDNVRACLGIYPIEAEKLTEKQIEKEIEFLKENKESFIGIGEVGLDGFEGEDIEKQKKVLEN